MEIQSKQLRRCDLVTVTGRLDSSTVPQLQAALTAIKDKGRYKIVLNMAEVTYVSSAGLGEMVATQNECKNSHRGELILVGVQPRIKEALDLAGLTRLFKFFEYETDAVGYF